MSDDDNSVENHEYVTPDEGTVDWHEPLNENFRRIDRDVEIRDEEAALDEYTPAESAKFLAVDTGRAFVGSGDEWELLTQVRNTNGAKIVCYETESAAYAETAEQTYEGSDVFDAAQKAIDTKLENGRGDFSVVFEPGYYVVENRLEITGPEAKNINRIEIRGEGSTDGAYFETRRLSGGTVLEIDPDARDIADDRIFGVGLANMNFDHRSRPGNRGGGAGQAARDEDGIYVNDTRNLHINRVSVQGYGHALRLRNIWQGEVDFLVCRTSGSDDRGVSPILVETGRTTSTRDWWDNQVHNAVNHLVFRNLQGGPRTEGDGFCKLSTPEVEGKTPRIRSIGIIHPNVECSGATFLHSHADAWVLIGDCMVKEPAPLIDQDGGRTAVAGGLIESPEQLLECQSGHAMFDGVDASSADSEDPALINFAGGWLNVSNVRTFAGKRAVRADAANVVTISGLHAQATEEAALFLQNVRQTAVSNVVLKNTNRRDELAERPVQMRNTKATSISNLLVSVAGGVPARPAIKDMYASGPMNVDDVIAGDNVSSVWEPHSRTKFQNWSGTATVTSGSTSVTVPHRLASTPDRGRLSVTPMSPLGQATNWYVDNVGAETFDIVLDSEPTDTDVSFGWRGSV